MKKEIEIKFRKMFVSTLGGGNGELTYSFETASGDPKDIIDFIDEHFVEKEKNVKSTYKDGWQDGYEASEFELYTKEQVLEIIGEDYKTRAEIEGFIGTSCMELERQKNINKTKQEIRDKLNDTKN